MTIKAQTHPARLCSTCKGKGWKPAMVKFKDGGNVSGVSTAHKACSSCHGTGRERKS